MVSERTPESPEDENERRGESSDLQPTTPFEAAPEAAPGAGDPDFDSEAPTRLLGDEAATERKRDLPDRIDHYRILEVLGEGGMGVVYLAEQTEPVQRKLALKVIKRGMDSQEVVARFEAERQALALMNHANIARVHKVGTTDDGLPYFSMEYVKGVIITEFCDQHRFTVDERLGLFIRVCRAIQHAHQKGVIHRDIKPTNILVKMQDDLAIPKVIDFGVAKATREELTETPHRTSYGQVIGTFEYMSPEQAEAGGVELDTRTDIYSLGVLLYELLAGALPFDSEMLRGRGLAGIQRTICEVEPPRPSLRTRVGDGDDTVAELRNTTTLSLEKRIRGDLDWIVMKAMDKDPMRRYDTAAEFAADVKRHLDHEPVEAGPPSVGYRVGKFVRRHRGAVISVAMLFVVLVAWLVTSTVLYFDASFARKEEQKARKDAEDAQRIAEVERGRADARASEAKASQAVAEARYDEIIRLADVKRLRDYEADAKRLWPAHPDRIPDIEEWLNEKAGPLVDRFADHEQSLASLREGALDYTEEQRTADRRSHPELEELERLQLALAERRDELLPHVIADAEQRIEELEALVSNRRTWRFDDTESQWRHDTLASLVSSLATFMGDDPVRGTYQRVRRHLEFTRTIEERSVTGEDAARAWRLARDDIALLEVYDGLVLEPQLGLLPLRRDPKSGLWQFWHLASGERPEPNPDPDADNPWIIDRDTGIVLVLVPAGKFFMGAQSTDASGRNHDERAIPDEGPVHEVELDAYFISRYEMTQGQWTRFTGRNPSLYYVENIVGGIEMTWVNPVEQVTWTACRDVLSALALDFPTEAQWEHAARARSDTGFFSGDDAVTLQGKANVADRFSKENGGQPTWSYDVRIEDGHCVHAPVGSFAPNRFGLHDVHGNVWEWCRDWFGKLHNPVLPGTGLRDCEGWLRVYRGGSWFDAPVDGRVTSRFSQTPEWGGDNLGVRPARDIE